MISISSNLIAELASHWSLSQIVPVANMTCNYVARAVQNYQLPVVLKISTDAKAIANEAKALRYFEGSATIKLLSYQEKYSALLLQQAIPGNTLKSLYPVHADFVNNCYATTVKKLHANRAPGHHAFCHIKDWLKALDNISLQQLPAHLVKKALASRNTLLTSLNREIILHGDLHHDNILQSGDDWLMIDPKGVVGEIEFEVSAFDFISPTEFENHPAIKSLFESRVKQLSDTLNLNAQRVKDWVFVRLILFIAWHFEDKTNPDWSLNLVNALF
jgi:streptomycin 6-kinase